MAQLPETTNGLHPAKDWFDELPFLLTELVPSMPRGPAIDRAVPRVLCHVGRDLERSDVVDKARDIVAFVARH